MLNQHTHMHNNSIKQQREQEANAPKIHPKDVVAQGMQRMLELFRVMEVIRAFMLLELFGLLGYFNGIMGY